MKTVDNPFQVRTNLKAAWSAQWWQPQCVVDRFNDSQKAIDECCGDDRECTGTISNCFETLDLLVGLFGKKFSDDFKKDSLKRCMGG
jgi:hypothetical protein